MQEGSTQQFTATVINSSSTTVSWQVNGIAGGKRPANTLAPCMVTRDGALTMSLGTPAAKPTGKFPLKSASAVTMLAATVENLGAAARIFESLAGVNVNVDMIVQNEPTTAGGLAEISFTVPREDLRVSQAALAPLTGEAFADMKTHEEMGKVSIIGAGMRSHPGVAAQVFETLAEREINIEMISTSPIKISCVIAGERVSDAVQLLHEAFELSGKDTILLEDPFEGPR